MNKNKCGASPRHLCCYFTVNSTALLHLLANQTNTELGWFWLPHRYNSICKNDDDHRYSPCTDKTYLPKAKRYDKNGSLLLNMKRQVHCCCCNPNKAKVVMFSGPVERMSPWHQCWNLLQPRAFPLTYRVSYKRTMLQPGLCRCPLEVSLLLVRAFHLFRRLVVVYSEEWN